MNQRFRWRPEVRKHYNTAVTGTYCRTGCQWQYLIPQDSQCTYNVTQAHSCNHCCSRKAIILLILSVFVALCIQHAMRMRHIFICGLTGTQYFSTLSLKHHDFRKKVIEHEICVLIFSTSLSHTLPIQRRTGGDIFILVHRSSPWLPAILVGFYWNFNYFDGVYKTTKTSNFIKIRPVEAESFHVDGETDKQTWQS
jgi:hypothetical protein